MSAGMFIPFIATIVHGQHVVSIRRAYPATIGLPTEQEWEKATRGIDGREYPWGDQEPTSELCNFNMHEGRTTPVGRYAPQGDSPYGCVDMSGNIWEWTASEEVDSGRVLRGGGWSHPAEYVRLVLRSIHEPDERYDTDGFRCVSEVLIEDQPLNYGAGIFWKPFSKGSSSR